MPRAALIWPITVKAAKAILQERRVTMAEFNQTGELVMDLNTKLTRVGRNTWQIIDFYNAKGANLKHHLTPQEQQKLPAVQEEMEAPTFEQNEGDREEAARNRHNLQILRAG